MKCPNCLQEAPDTNYKCPFCGEVLRTGVYFRQVYQSPKKKKSPNINHFLMIIALLGLVIIATLMIQQASGGKVADANHAGGSVALYQPGERAELHSLLHNGKTTIFDFYSDYCPPCRKISPRLEELDRKRDDIVVVKININRKNVRGIDWNSPLARQYDLRSIPYFIIYDSSGHLTHKGNAAWQQVYQLLTEEGI